MEERITRRLKYSDGDSVGDSEFQHPGVKNRDKPVESGLDFAASSWAMRCPSPAAARALIIGVRVNETNRLTRIATAAVIPN